MDTHFDCDNCRDFMVMTCNGELCPNKPVQLRSMGGDKIQMITYEDQVKNICRENGINILEILTQVYEQIMQDMIVRGNNTPVFKKRVSSVMEQWKDSPEYEELFILPEKEFSFEYSNLVNCNSRILELNEKIKRLEELISVASEELYSEIVNLQGDCKMIDNDIKLYLDNLDQLSNYYEPRYPNILMDLSTKPKSFYTHGFDEKDDTIKKMVYHKNFREIPDNIPEIFSNAIFIPNMITKETDFIRESLRNLRGDVRNKNLLLAELKGNVPEKRKMDDPFIKFFRYFVDSSEEESDNEYTPSEILGELEDDLQGDLQDVSNTDVDKSEVSSVLSDNEEEDKEEPSTKPLTKKEVDDIEKLMGEVVPSDKGFELTIDEKTKKEPEKQLVDLAKKKGDKYELSFF